MTEWLNEAGWRVVLNVREQVNATLALYAPGEQMPVLYRQYEWWELYRAQSEAEGLVRLGMLREVARVRGA